MYNIMYKVYNYTLFGELLLGFSATSLHHHCPPNVFNAAYVTPSRNDDDTVTAVTETAVVFYVIYNIRLYILYVI